MNAATPEVYWTVLPNWGTVSFSHVWMTGIMTSIFGGEQRSALFTWPRRNLKFSVLPLSYKEKAFIQRKLFSEQSLVWGVPLWQDITVLTELAEKNTSTLNVEDTTNRHFETGKEIIVFSKTDPTIFDVGVISSFTDNKIELVGFIKNDWESDSFVFPVMPSLLQVEQKVTMITAMIGTLEIEAKEQFTL